MAAQTIGFVLRNPPAFLFILALIIAALASSRGSTAERFLSWVLLLPIGITGLWAGVTHVFFPEVAATHIGWQTSPFQFEVGVADLAVGLTACLSFWRVYRSRQRRSVRRRCSCLATRSGMFTR